MDSRPVLAYPLDQPRRILLRPGCPVSAAERSSARTAFARGTPEAACSSTPGCSRGRLAPPAPVQQNVRAVQVRPSLRRHRRAVQERVQKQPVHGTEIRNDLPLLRRHRPPADGSICSCPPAGRNPTAPVPSFPTPPRSPDPAATGRGRRNRPGPTSAVVARPALAPGAPSTKGCKHPRTGPPTAGSNPIGRPRGRATQHRRPRSAFRPKNQRQFSTLRRSRQVDNRTHHPYAKYSWRNPTSFFQLLLEEEWSVSTSWGTPAQGCPGFWAEHQCSPEPRDSRSVQRCCDQELSPSLPGVPSGSAPGLMHRESGRGQVLSYSARLPCQGCRNQVAQMRRACLRYQSITGWPGGRQSGIRGVTPF